MKKRKWDIEKSKKLYRIEHWGQDYFSLNDSGHIVVHPDQNPEGPAIDLTDVIEEIKGQNIPFPVVVRFHDILRNQVKKLNEAFKQIIEEEAPKATGLLVKVHDAVGHGLR